MLMTEPEYPKAFSEHYGPDYRRDHINQYKLQANNLISIIDELVTRKAEVVEKTPFDNYQDNLALKLIDQRFQELYSIISKNSEITTE
jgi:hypothetical protein